VWGSAPAPLLDWLRRTNTLALESWTGLSDELRREFEAGEFQPPSSAATNNPAPARKSSRRLRATAGATNAPESELLLAARDLVGQRACDAVLIVWPGLDEALARHTLGRLTVYYDSVRPASAKASDRIENQLDGFRAHLLKQREQERSLPAGFTRALVTRVEDVALPQRRAGSFIGFALPFLLITLSAVSALYPAIDFTAGEKDRATMARQQTENLETRWPPIDREVCLRHVPYGTLLRQSALLQGHRFPTLRTVRHLVDRPLDTF
jgi:sodium transport system permease protein